jgi:AcrR family transcriptional regulator
LNRSESKYFATAERMDEAFLALLEKKDFAFITVKEICRMAGVNRSTFYLHYETVDDLLEECVQHIIRQFAASMPFNTAEFIGKLESCPLTELFLITPAYLKPYLNYIKEHRRIFRATVEHAATLKMVDAFNALNRNVFVPIMNRFQVPEEQQNYLIKFQLGGLLAILNEWLLDDCRDSIEQMIEVIQMCVPKPE